MRSAIAGVIGVFVLAGIVWGVWVYTTWALQARTAGWVSALCILAFIVGLGRYLREVEMRDPQMRAARAIQAYADALKRRP